MIEFYPQILMVHIWAISLSGALFFTRALASLFGAKWCHLFGVRILSYLIDITLLTAAAILYTILPKEIFANGWLHLKLLLVVLYIVFGFVAMRKNNPRHIRITLLGLAAICYFLIIGIAINHHPLGWFYS